jgi:hypothetical protein
MDAQIKRKDEIYYIGYTARLKKKKILSLYSNKKSTIALGATPIGSAGHAPDEDENIGSNAGVKIDFIIGGKQPDNKLDVLLPSGGGGIHD